MLDNKEEMIRYCPVCAEEISPRVSNNGQRWILGDSWKDCCSKECARYQHLANALLIAITPPEMA